MAFFDVCVFSLIFLGGKFYMKRRHFSLLILASVFTLGLTSCEDAAQSSLGSGSELSTSTADPNKTIEKIEKTASTDNVDTYTITFLDGTTFTFTVTNGEDGEDGHSPVITVNENGHLVIDGEDTGVDIVGEDGHSPKVTIGTNGNWFVDDVDTGVSAKGEKGDKGEAGEDGRGIVSIKLTSSEGNVDTYTITYTDGTTSTFTVTNGKDGEQGIKGEDGHSSEISISEDGYWVIDGEKTDFKATGEVTVVEEYYSVTFDLNGGEFLDFDPETYSSVAEGSSLDLPVPFRDNYSFEGWYTGRGINDGQFTSASVVSGDLSLVAKWTSISDRYQLETEKEHHIDNYYSIYYSYSLDHLSTYEKLMEFIGRVNFASDRDEIFQIDNEFHEWFNSIPADQETINSYLEGWAVRYEEYVQRFNEAGLDMVDFEDKYQNLVNESSNNQTIQSFQELVWRMDALFFEMEDYLHQNSFDEYYRDERYEYYFSENQKFIIIFGDLYNEILNQYGYNIEEILSNLLVAQTNLEVDDYSATLEYYFNELRNNYDIYSKYSAEFTQNVISHMDLKWGEATAELEPGSYEEYQMRFDELKNEFSGNPNDDYYFFDKYIENFHILIDELLRVNSIEFSFWTVNPFNFFDGANPETYSALLGDTVDISSYVKQYEENGFVLEGIYLNYDNNNAVFSEPLDPSCYSIENCELYVSNEYFDPMYSNYYFLYFKYSVSDASLARDALLGTVLEFEGQIDQAYEMNGLEPTDFSEEFAAVKEKVGLVTDQTTYDEAYNEVDSLYMDITIDIAIKMYDLEVAKLLEKYPTLVDDPLYEETMAQYETLKESLISATSFEEMTSYMYEIGNLIQEVQKYAESLA